jgi:hypothetical protein
MPTDYFDGRCNPIGYSEGVFFWLVLAGKYLIEENHLAEVLLWGFEPQSRA